MSDPISSLPVDKSSPSHQEMQLVETFFKTKMSRREIIMKESIDVGVAGILFVVLSIPKVDEFIKKIYKKAENSTFYLLLVKVVIFCILFFLLKNLQLIRKNG